MLKLKKFKGKAMCLMFVMLLMMPSAIFAQQTARQITGVVTEANGDLLPGVTVLEKGTSNGTVTDAYGKYTFRVADKNETVLVFSFIGFESREIKINNLRTINVTMKESVQILSDVVVVGYGSQKKESVIGAIAQATEKELKHTGNVPDFATALTGQIPGLVTITSSGEPGGTGWGESATQIFLRGKNTWTDATPLILVDGIERDLNNIDVNEVASMSVLKDASATAVFGVRGGNGVILINTKRGEAGKTKLTASFMLTGESLSKVPKLLDSYDALMAKNESIERELANRPESWQDIMPYEVVRQYRYPDKPEYSLIYPNIDWQKAVIKPVNFSQKANINAQGGNETVRYFTSLSYLKEGSIFKYFNNNKGYDPAFDFSRFNFRSNVDVQLTHSTQVKVNFDGYFGTKRQNYSGAGQPQGGTQDRNVDRIWRAVYGLAPDLYPPMNGPYWGIISSLSTQVPNPAMLLYNQGIVQNRTTSLNSIVTLEQDLNSLIKGLKASVTVNYNTAISTDGGIADNTSTARSIEVIPQWKNGGGIGDYTLAYYPTTTGDYSWFQAPWSVRGESVGSGNWYTWRSTLPVYRLFSYQGQLNYARSFLKVHNVTATGVFRREEQSNGSEFTRYYEEWIGRVTYDYSSRYFFEFNGAYNGSEQFGPGYRFAFFPSLALGWYLSNEKFFKVNWIDKLKFRASRGLVGNDRIGSARWLYVTQYGTQPNGMVRLGDPITSDGSPYNSYFPNGPMGNPNISWEQSLKNNIGFEAGVFKSLFTLSVDAYNEDRTRMLLSGALAPDYFGLYMPIGNTGHLKARGYEIELGFNKMINQLFLYGKFYIAHNQNKVIYREDPALKPDYQKQAGHALGQQYSNLTSGFIQNWDQAYASPAPESLSQNRLPGNYQFIDFNGDGIINADDSAPIGYSDVPQNTANVSVGADYRGFSFMIQFYGVNNVNRSIPLNNFANYTDVLYDHVKDYWSKDNPNASSFLPRWRLQGQDVGQYYMYDGSYLKLRAAELAYTFQKSEWLTKSGISNLKISLQGNDLFFWSKMPDPRESGGGNGAYPLVRRVNLGLELSF